MKPRLSIAGVGFVLAAAAAITPLLGAWPLLHFSVTQFFHVICHQDPARSFFFAGAPMALCIRCMGIYLGAVIGAFLACTRRQALLILLAALVLTALDVFSEMAGLRGNWPVVRFLVGMFLGAAIAALVASTVLQERRARVRAAYPS